MSSTLYWRQAHSLPPEHDLPYELKKAVSQRLWAHDGSLYGDEMLVTKAHVPYFEGLADAGVEGASEVVAAIHAHGEILLWIGE